MPDALKTRAYDLVAAYYKESLLNVDTVLHGNLAQLTSVEAIRTASEPLKAEILQNTFIDPATLLPTFTSTLTRDERNTLFHIRIPLVHMLLTYPLPYTAEIIHGLVEYVKQNYFTSQHPETLIRVFSSLDPALFAAIKPYLFALRDAMTNAHRDGMFHKDTRMMIYNIDTLLHGPQQGPVRIMIDDWGALVLDIYDAMPDEIKQPWAALLDHVQRGAGSKNLPSAKWLAQTPALIEALGQAQFVQVVTAWLNAFGQHRGMRPAEANGNLLRGLAWLCATVPDRTLAAALADAAIEGYRKISGQGPRSPKISSACVYALQAMPNLYGAAQLERVRLNVKQLSYKKEIEKALNALAQRAQLSREDLEELTLPSYGFVDGVLRVHFGPAYAELTLTSDDLKLQWYDERGNPRKSEPAEVKKTYKAERKEFKLLQDEIVGMVQAQKARIERLPLAQRTWSFAAWCERYRDHQLLAPLVHALIWRFTDGDTTLTAMWHGDHFVNAHGEPVEPSPTATVFLWHPIFSEASEVLAWRVWLEQQGITQPYKQAHREVYLLTDAERRTATYSNRFAAHILRQHQFHALTAARGWGNKLRLMVDDSVPPACIELPHWDLRAEYWIEGAGDDTNNSGSYLYLTTDQVRFHHLDAPQNFASTYGGRYTPDRRSDSPGWGPVPLAEIPPLVFSEIMRDVDLFVGVASVGNDPAWADNGPAGHHTYWQAFSFGDLSATAQTRRDLLSRLLPRLAIARQCRIDGRFLIVEGKLRTYKIHLGSGNILMEPNDQYLCIVPQRTANSVEVLHLPFQGDQIFAVILSKALMLAEDTKIKDPSIISQINVHIKATETN